MSVYDELAALLPSGDKRVGVSLEYSPGTALEAALAENERLATVLAALLPLLENVVSVATDEHFKIKLNTAITGIKKVL